MRTRGITVLGITAIAITASWLAITPSHAGAAGGQRGRFLLSRSRNLCPPLDQLNFLSPQLRQGVVSTEQQLPVFLKPLDDSTHVKKEMDFAFISTILIDANKKIVGKLTINLDGVDNPDNHVMILKSRAGHKEGNKTRCFILFWNMITGSHTVYARINYKDTTPSQMTLSTTFYVKTG
jgi:hypothetical protein